MAARDYGGMKEVRKIMDFHMKSVAWNFFDFPKN